jgi:DNA-directed RNA polymerase beta subunit
MYSVELLGYLQDYVGNKRLELAGQLIALLFEVSCYQMNNS